MSGFVNPFGWTFAHCDPPAPARRLCDKLDLTADGILRCSRPVGHDGKHVMVLGDLLGARSESGALSTQEEEA